MRTLLVLVFTLLAASCSLVPDAVVRVALPSGDEEASRLWSAAAAALPQGSPPVEVVAPGSWPPADLVWAAGPLGDDLDHALLADPASQDAAAQAGLAPGWFAVEGSRIVPLVWIPWAWWSAPGAAEPGLVPQRDRLSMRALAASRHEVTIGADDDTVGLTPAEVKASFEAGQAQRVWLPAGLAPSGAAAEAAEAVPTRVRGLWWDERGWNRQAAARLVKALVSAPVQGNLEGVLAPQDGWRPAARGPEALRRAAEVVVLP